MHPNSIAALKECNRVGRTKTPINHISLIELIKALELGIYSCEELAEQSGLHYTTVLAFCRAAHRNKLIHIHMWEKDSRGRDAIRIFKWGKGVNAKRSAKTPAERQKLRRDKVRQIKLVSMFNRPSEETNEQIE